MIPAVARRATPRSDALERRVGQQEPALGAVGAEADDHLAAVGSAGDDAFAELVVHDVVADRELRCVVARGDSLELGRGAGARRLPGAAAAAARRAERGRPALVLDQVLGDLGDELRRGVEAPRTEKRAL